MKVNWIEFTHDDDYTGSHSSFFVGKSWELIALLCY